MVLLRLMVLIWLLVLVVLLLLLVLVLLMAVAIVDGTAGVVEMVLVDEVVLLLLRSGVGRGKPVGAEIVAGKVLAIVVGRGVINVLCLIATTALLGKNRKFPLFICVRKNKKPSIDQDLRCTSISLKKKLWSASVKIISSIR